MLVHVRVVLWDHRWVVWLDATMVPMKVVLWDYQWVLWLDVTMVPVKAVTKVRMMDNWMAGW